MADARRSSRTQILVRGRLGAVLASRAFVPVAIGMGVLFLATNTLLIALRLGWTPPAFAQRHAAISITGPGIGGTPDPLQAYVLGAVAEPGVYALPVGARVSDLVRAAGGLMPDADVARVDLAALVADGQEVYVPHIGEVVSADVGGLVNLNLASAQDLHLSLGLTLEIARRIVAYRTTHGPFTAISQLLLVPISRSTYDRIKYLVIV